MAVIESEDINKQNKKQIGSLNENANISSSRNIVSIFIIALVGLTYGLGLMTPIVEKQSSRLLSPEFSDAKFTFTFDTGCAVLLVGGGIGHALYTFFVSDSINNKEYLLLGSFLNLIVFFLIFFYPHVYLIVVARLVMGLIAGFGGAIVPNAIYRLSPEKWRGFFISFYPAGIVLGLLIGQILSYYNSPELFWISHFTACGIFLLQTLFLFFVTGINEEIEDSKEFKIIETIKDENVRRSLIIALVFHIAAHLSGINFVTMFFDEVLSKTDNPYLYGIINLAIAFIFKFFSGYLCDLGGRKLLFSISCLLGAISLLFMNLIEWQHIAIGCYMLSFSLGLGCIPWIILGEVFPAPYTKPGTFIAVMVNWSIAFILTVFTKIIYEFFGNWVYIFFAGCIILSAIIIGIIFKETKGQKHAQLQ